jgi:hypothetical protein
MPINTSSLTGGGSPINSIQRGTSSTGTATIAAVDVDKSFVVVTNAGGGSAMSATLNSSTSLGISGTNVRWQVIEYV